MMRTAHHNPFRADRITALPFVGRNVRAVADRFARTHYRGAIEGDEGTGKSTLMHAIGQVLIDRHVAVAHVGLPGSATRFQRALAVRLALKQPAGAVVLFDGFEQLGTLQRLSVRRRQRLIATAHRPIGLPTMVRLKSRPGTFKCLLQRLLLNTSDETMSFAHGRLIANRGDMRTTFLDLYDAWAAGRIDGVAYSAVADTAISTAEP